MAIQHSEPGVETALLRARAVVQTLDEALDTLAAGAPALPSTSRTTLPAALSARVRETVTEIDGELAAFEQQHAEVSHEARSWAERAVLAERQGRADMAAQAERRRAQQAELAQALAHEVSQLRELRARAVRVLGCGESADRRADV
jgi:hypothetical protein